LQHVLICTGIGIILLLNLLTFLAWRRFGGTIAQLYERPLLGEYQ